MEMLSHSRQIGKDMVSRHKKIYSRKFYLSHLAQQPRKGLNRVKSMPSSAALSKFAGFPVEQIRSVFGDN